jgi:hypothetical protein
VSISRRLEALEARNATARADEEERVSREALRRITTENLRLVHAYLKRAVEGDAEPTGDEEAALRRYEEIKREVRGERSPANRTPGRRP